MSNIKSNPNNAMLKRFQLRYFKFGFHLTFVI